MLRFDDLLPTLVSNLEHPKKALRRETYWALSNIFAGNPEAIDKLLKYPNLIETLIRKLSSEPNEVSYCGVK